MDIHVLADKVFMAVFDVDYRFNSIIDDYYFYDGLIRQIKCVTGKDIELVDIVVGNVVEVFFKF